MPVKFEPLGDRILIAVFSQVQQIEGVLLPDSSKEDMQAGIVIAAGENVPLRTDIANTALLEVGDHVMFGPWAGKDIQIEGVPFRVLRFEEIDGKVVQDAGSEYQSAGRIRLVEDQ